MVSLSAQYSRLVFLSAAVLVMVAGCKTSARVDGTSEAPLGVADTPHPICEHVTEALTRWPAVEASEPVRVEPTGPIACVDGEAVPFDGLQTLSDVVVPYEAMRAMVENLAKTRVNRYLFSRALEEAGEAVDVTEDEFAAASARFRAGFDSKTEVDAFLANVTDKPFHVWFERRMRIRKLIELRTDRAPVATRGDARAYYDAHAREFTEPKSYELVQVFFPVPEHANNSQIQDVQARARRLADAAREDGADLQTLGDEATDYGAQELDEPMENLSVALAKAVENATPGQVLGPLETDYGYYVVRLEKVHPAEKTPFEDVADQLVGRLSRNAYKAAIRELRKQLRAQADIDMLWGNLEVEVAE